MTLVACVLALVPGTAEAGGPLALFDEATGTPYAYPPGTVDIYTDLGPNGILSNGRSDTLTANGFAQWTAVPTSYFSAAVAGEITVGGVPTDITLANADSILGPFNGGGIHVIYDTNGSIVAGFFGAPPGVAGIASPEYSDTNSPDLLESWAVINGNEINPADTSPPGNEFAGIYTHEFGHSINLAHTKTNGGIIFFGDNTGASGCASLGGILDFSHTETMYPFIDPTPGSTGSFQATVELLDDVAALSDIYPAAGWPATHGTITGTVSHAVSGEVTGVNVIARNLADPLGDANSAISGDYSQGLVGPDGLFTLNGLTPGASYVLQVDKIENGGFSTTPTNLFFIEEYYNGAGESGDLNADTVCVYVPIVPIAGTPITADIILNADTTALNLGDDSVIQLALPFSFSFCGASYDSVWLAANGFLTFGASDVGFNLSGTGLVTGPPRLAGLWSDLDPSTGGVVTAKEIDGNFVVTFNSVPEFLFGGSNTFSMTLRPDHTHQFSYGACTTIQNLTGRSPGGGVADPGVTNLDIAPQPLGNGVDTVYEEYFLSFDLSGMDLEWASCGDVTAVVNPGYLPRVPALLQSSPNPFRVGTAILFDLPRAGKVRLNVFDVQGRLVRSLVDEELIAGRHSIPWDGDSDLGRAAGPGIYFYRLEAPGFTAARKAIRLQ